MPNSSDTVANGVQRLYMKKMIMRRKSWIATSSCTWNASTTTENSVIRTRQLQSMDHNCRQRRTSIKRDQHFEGRG